MLAGISGAEQELQALQEQRKQLQPAAKEAAELRCAIAQLQVEVRGCLWCGACTGGQQRSIQLLLCSSSCTMQGEFAARLIDLVELM